MLIGRSVTNSVIDCHRVLDGHVGPQWVGEARDEDLNLLAS